MKNLLRNRLQLNYTYRHHKEGDMKYYGNAL